MPSSDVTNRLRTTPEQRRLLHDLARGLACVYWPFGHEGKSTWVVKRRDTTLQKGAPVPGRRVRARVVDSIVDKKLASRHSYGVVLTPKGKRWVARSTLAREDAHARK